MVEQGKELIFVDGQEGFISLKIPLKIAHGREYVIHTDTGNINNEVIFKIYPFNFIPCNELFPKEIRQYLTILNISMNNIRQEYNKIIKPYAKALEALEKAIELNKSHPYIIKRFNRTMSQILYLQRKSAFEDFHIDILNRLIQCTPSKYYRYFDERREWVKGDDTYFINATCIELKVQALSYLEQQVELKRIELKKEEFALLIGMKESMRVHDEITTFDSYIHRWALSLMGLDEAEFKVIKSQLKKEYNASAYGSWEERNTPRYRLELRAKTFFKRLIRSNPTISPEFNVLVKNIHKLSDADLKRLFKQSMRLAGESDREIRLSLKGIRRYRA